jgi:broad specificity phosphatase PhoE
MLFAPKPTEILVLRHAEVHNPRDLVYGRLPRFGLSATGRTQAEHAGRFLASRPLDAVYSSPLLRARQTASIVSGYHPRLRLRTSSSLLEVRTGYEGGSNAIYKPGFSFYEPLKEPDDETMQDVFQRMLAFARKVARRHAGGTVLLVSHADPIAILRVGLEGLPLTVANLHATVYPARASLTQVFAGSESPPRLAYFNIAGARA